MRALGALLLSLVACSSAKPAAPVSPAPAPAPAVARPEPAVAPPPADPAPVSERLTADTPKTTVGGNTFIAPAGWTITVVGPATILAAPEGDSHLALVDVQAETADAAVAAAWAAYKPDARWPLQITTTAPDQDGWTDRTRYSYQTSPNERRDVFAITRKANGLWTVAIYDASTATGEKRAAQVGLVFGRLLPKGNTRESFAGKRANRLDEARIAELSRFVDDARRQLGIPGVSVGLYQDGKVVFAGGFGVRALGKKAKVDADTRYPIASNTKAMATLMLAKLVDANRLTWDTPAASLLPTFKLGDPDTTAKVLVKHLICACTGMPRQDLEWLLEWKGLTPADAMAALGTMQPTSEFGELFQYSNAMAAAAGFIGGHVAYPALELGAAYDRAMQTLVFDPLKMKATTFDFAKAQRGNFAVAHSVDLDGAPARAVAEVNAAVRPMRPAGGAWSNVHDVLKYVAMELADGKLPDGTEYIARDVLLARRAPQVAIGTDATYGMGLMVDTTYGVPVVHHGGDLIGFHSDMMWLPDHGVGAVILTNGDPGSIVRDVFRRKLLEVLFDGRPEADAQISSAAKRFFDGLASERKLLTVPAAPAEAAKLAARYAHPTLGEIAVIRKGGKTVFDFGEFRSEMASKQHPDGSVSFVTIVPGLTGLELVVGSGSEPTLVLRDSQHEYVFAAR